MICRDVIEQIEAVYDKKYALDWDNVGLLVGRDDKIVKKIYLALDPTDEVIEEAISMHADMLITHHPLIFGSIKCVNNLDFEGRRVLRLAQNDISYYAMHTNYDVKGMADLSIQKLGMDSGEVLDVTSVEVDGREEGIGRVYDMKTSMSLGECCEMVKEAYDLDCVRVFGDVKQMVHRLAICPGAGKSDILTALSKGADVYVTGDIGHHDGLDAVAQGLSVIDAGHYGIEHIFVEDMKQYLEERLSGVEIVAAPVKHPFVTI